MTLQSYSGVYIQRKLYLKGYMHSSVPSSTIYKTCKQPKGPLTDEWRRTIQLYIHNGIQLSHKKEIK